MATTQVSLSEDEEPGETPGAPRRRPWKVIAIVVAAAVVVAGVVWWVVARRADPPSFVVQGTVQATVLSRDEASVVVGSSLAQGATASAPSAALSAEPDTCVIAVGPASESVYAREWTAFLSTTYQDSAHTVTQVVGLYPGHDTAAAAFGRLEDGIGKCPSAVRKDPGRSSSWVYSVESSSADALVWTAAQDAADGWACYRQARLKGRVLFQVAVCEAGNGRTPAKQIADGALARVAG
ncbi:sensor domain-containing protein [Amycolatopsis acidicola]|uniref:Sensor domain-containing protein n=1 Tax=Amycolatopsis acidicola TaxID=2596893 RepID=A0A5N0VLB7_9PSEU|nr:sensor domain-containing protein [Amycolatopsis acidicola]KAA9166323.1 sensor domain-containing protein [Amycolatopsis acidicola]